MTHKRKYLIKKVAEDGEDVIASAAPFDALLKKMLDTSPLPLSKLREEPSRLAARRPRKDSGPK
jgi:hypothetical protein